MEEHELRQSLAERILLIYCFISLMDIIIAVVEISLVSFLIQLLLIFVHIAEVVEIIGITHCYTVLGIGKIAQNQLPVTLGFGCAALTHIHQIKIIISVEAVNIVGIVAEQTVELSLGSTEVLELVLENDTHIIQTLLNNIVSRIFLLVGLRNLGEIVFGIMRVRAVVVFLVLFLVFWCFLFGTFCAFISGFGTVSGIEIIGIERRFIAATPVVLELTRTPALLELRLARIARSGVIEIP